MEDKKKENNEKFFTIKKNEILNEEDYSLNQLIYYKKNNEKNTSVKKIGEFIEESTERYSDGEKNVLSISNKYGFIKPEEIFSHQIASEDIKNYKRVEKDYFAYNPSRINVGSIALYNLNRTAYVSPMYVVFKNNKKEILNNEYLYHFLKSKKGNELIIANSIGSIRNTLKFKNLSNIEISIPSIDEQNSKVDELNSYQTIINNCYEIIENYKPKIDTVENWNISKLKDLAEFTYGLGASAEDNGRYRFIRITDIDDKGLLINEGKKFVNIKDDEKKYILNKGDVLIARTGATYGKCLYFNSDEPSIYAGYLIKVSLDLNKVLPKFFWIYCQTQEFLIQKNQLVVGGGQPQFNANTLGEVKISYPSLDEQKMIIEKIEKEQKIIFNNYELVKIFQNKIDEIFS